MSPTLPLLEQLRNLEHLQSLDLQIDQFRKEQKVLPLVLEKLHEKRGQRQAIFEKQVQESVEFERLIQQTVAALELNQDRLSRSMVKLNVVQNAQEFQSISKEIDQLKKLDSSLGEQRKKYELDLKELQDKQTPLELECLELQGSCDAQTQLLVTQQQELEARIQTLEEQKHQWTQGVEPRLLAQYNRVRVARGGTGIVSVQGGRCQGCHMMLPPQLFNEVQKSLVLHACPSCHRLLVVPAPELLESVS